ncbi:MAG: cobalamin biosynthesis protein [Oscillibacter sp.]|nr:cobalamin biosynthesis protein [Oscillibacter sp.]
MNTLPENSVTETENRPPERHGIAYLSFTARGKALSERLCAALGGAASCTRDAPAPTLSGWTAENFPCRRALVYVGAAGIAVRAVAPYLRGKAVDPAVIAVDECGRFAVPLVSGHLGGANELARRIASVTGGAAAVTTATDVNGVFAVDEWARRHNCAVVPVSGIKAVSAKILNGETVRVYTAFPMAGDPPEGVELVRTAPEGVELVQTMPDVWVGVRRRPPLSLVPRILTLGVGCRRGTDADALKRRFSALCDKYELFPEAFRAAATIDIKAHEPGLLTFCAAHGWKLHVYRADELRRVPGTFTASAFVERRTGVDNVCERAAVLSSGGKLIVTKCAGDGVTFAVAQDPFSMDWS